MLARNVAIGLLSFSTMIAAACLFKLFQVEQRLESFEGQLQWCTWNHGHYGTKLIKGTKDADKFRRDVGRPSDEGECN